MESETAWDDDRRERADRLFDAALDIPLEERESFLEEECRDDPELRAHVLRLLGHSTDEPPLPGVVATADGVDAPAEEHNEPAPLTGRTVGGFHVDREIGRGSMAIVYLAHHSDGKRDQQVALKVIRPGVDIGEVPGRSSRVREIVALPSHPNVARLFEDGTTDDGRRYFVMEPIEGLPIDRYCDNHGLTLHQRLELFRQVAGALAHTHRSQVVHGGVQPSNLLVTADGTVKLLDFGIAGRVETKAAAARTSWASPEQVRGEPVTTSSDVYQSGLLLYRLLTGESAYRVDATNRQALLRAIRDETPIRPSQVVTRSSPTSRRQLAGDLDNIVLMALRKEPDRRYASIAQVLDDIDRFLTGHPVSARPNTLTYRLSKLVLRHRVASAFAGLALVTLVALAVTRII